jgi:hypothetical protein
LERDGRSKSAAFCRRWRIIVSMGAVRERIFCTAIFAMALSDFQGFNFGSLSWSFDNCRVGVWQVTCKCSPLHMGWFNLCPKLENAGDSRFRIKPRFLQQKQDLLFLHYSNGFLERS